MKFLPVKQKDAFSIPAWVSSGWIIKSKNGHGKSRYDFQFNDKEGFKVTIEGLSRSFDKILELCKTYQWCIATWNANTTSS